MVISTISALNGTPQQQGVKSASANVLAAIQSIITGANSNDVASVAIAAQLQSQTGGLKALASNLVQASSLTQVASNGTSQIGNALTELQTLAQQAASPTTNAATGSALDQQAQALLNQIDQTANGTTFGGQSLLDGSLSGSNALSLDALLTSGSNSSTGDSSLSLDSLATSSLFGGQGIDLSSNTDAAQALTAIVGALNQVGGAQSNIGSFQQTLNYATANVETALANQQAAQSSLSEADFSGNASNLAQASLQQNAAVATAAQGNNLNPALLQLVG